MRAFAAAMEISAMLRCMIRHLEALGCQKLAHLVSIIITPISNVMCNSNIVRATRRWQRHVAGDVHQRHMPETDALGLDYSISTPDVQLIQSQPVHSEHMHNGTTSEATLCLFEMCRWCMLPATCRCDNTCICNIGTSSVSKHNISRQHGRPLPAGWQSAGRNQKPMSVILCCCQTVEILNFFWYFLFANCLCVHVATSDVRNRFGSEWVWFSSVWITWFRSEITVIYYLRNSWIVNLQQILGPVVPMLL